MMDFAKIACFYFSLNSFIRVDAPPSHSTSTAVRNPLRGSATVAIAYPSSSGVPILFSAVLGISEPPTSTSILPISVAIRPGDRETTRMPCLPRSKADFLAYHITKSLEKV